MKKTVTALLILGFVASLAYAQRGRKRLAHIRKRVENMVEKHGFKDMAKKKTTHEGISLEYKKMPSDIADHAQKIAKKLKKPNWSKWIAPVLEQKLPGAMTDIGTFNTPHHLKIGSKKVEPGEYGFAILYRNGVYKLALVKEVVYKMRKRKVGVPISLSKRKRMRSHSDLTLEIIPEPKKKDQFRIAVKYRNIISISRKVKITKRGEVTKENGGAKFVPEKKKKNEKKGPDKKEEKMPEKKPEKKEKTPPPIR